MLEMYKFNDNCKTIVNGERVIIANRSSGAWMKISMQCYDVLKIGIRHRLTPIQLIEKLADEEDRSYFTKLFEKLNELGVINSTENNESDNIKKIKHIYFAVTNRCNLKCIHCCFDAAHSEDVEFLSTNEALTIIDKILECNPGVITFTGGEPLLRKDFSEILKYTAKKYNGIINLSTNATLINKENVKVLSLLLSSIDISIDGCDEESCSFLRGPGVFSKVIESIKLLQENNFEKISLSMVLVDENKHLEEQFRYLNKSLGTKPVIRNFSPLGRGKINKEILITGEINKEKLSFSQDKLEDIRRDINICNCGAGHKEMLINYDGFIYPCGLLIDEKYKLGNINEIENINSYFKNKDNCKFQGYKYLAEIQPDVFYKCKECNVNLFCWSCLHHIDLIKNDETALHARCSASKQLLSKVVWNT